jgi:hypothetical protein
MYLTVEPTTTATVRIDARVLTYNGIVPASLPPGTPMYANATAGFAFAGTPRPANDDPTSPADLIPLNSGTVIAPLRFATTLAPPEIELPGLPVRARESVWYRWQAPAAGLFKLQVIPGQGPGARPLGVRVQSPGGALLFDGPSSPIPPLLVQSGDVLTVAIYQTPTGCCNLQDYARDASVKWTLGSRPSNDDVGAAIDIAKLPGFSGGFGSAAVSVSTPDSTVEPGEPNTDPAEVWKVRGSVWWRYQANANAVVTVTGSSFAPGAGSDVFTGTGFSDFTWTGSTVLNMVLKPGDAIWIRVRTVVAAPATLEGSLSVTVGPDADLDSIADDVDNCPDVPNDQSDADGDGIGDAC